MNVTPCIAVYEFAAATLTAVGSYIYVAGKFISFANTWWLVLTTLLFAYLFRSIVEMYLGFIVCVTTRAEIIPALSFCDGIPDQHRAALVYCVRAETTNSVDVALASLRQSLKDNDDGNLTGLYLSGSSDLEIIRHEIRGIRNLQKLYGTKRILYFHRVTNWGKKWGGYQDLMLWLASHQEYPLAYTGNRYRHRKRDPNTRFFGLKSLQDSVTNKEITPIELETGIVGDPCLIDALRITTPVRYVLISDADVHWPPASAIQLVGKMAHHANRRFGIFQPMVAIRNGAESIYTQLLSLGREFCEAFGLAIWKIYGTYGFYGKAGINVESYIAVFLQQDHEVLNPQVLSHDFIEAMYLRTAYLPDIRIEEDVPSNYLEDLSRLQRWTLGDLIGLGQEIMHSFSRIRCTVMRQEPSTPAPVQPSAHLMSRLVSRFEFAPAAFAAYLLVTLIGGFLPGMYLTANLSFEIGILWFVMLGVLVLPRLLAPIGRWIHLRRSSVADRPWRLILLAPIEMLLSTLLFLQQLIDRNVALTRAVGILLSSRLRGSGLDWISSTDQRTSLDSISYWKLYAMRVHVALLGTLLPLTLYFTQPLTTVFYTAPIWLSFLVGPALIKLTARPRASGERR